MVTGNIASVGVEALRQRAIRLEYFTVVWNVAEAVVALIAGIVASSIALVGFGLDSIIETASGLALLWRFKQRGLEEEAAESRAVKVVGVTFFALAIYVGYEAVSDLRLRHAPEFSLPGFILALLSLIVMPVLGVAKRQTARMLKSRALAADGMETFLCAYLSAALLLGLGLNGLLGWWWADPVAGLVIAAFMVREGYEAFA
ncbi:MAG: cation transporter, partial [Acidobacteria bacterium]|nr:cation transporter [Acidobacteriota bacterium]